VVFLKYSYGECVVGDVYLCSVVLAFVSGGLISIRHMPHTYESKIGARDLRPDSLFGSNKPIIVLVVRAPTLFARI